MGTAHTQSLLITQSESSRGSCVQPQVPADGCFPFLPRKEPFLIYTIEELIICFHRIVSANMQISIQFIHVKHRLGKEYATALGFYRHKNTQRAESSSSVSQKVT